MRRGRGKVGLSFCLTSGRTPEALLLKTDIMENKEIENYFKEKILPSIDEIIEEWEAKRFDGKQERIMRGLLSGLFDFIEEVNGTRQAARRYRLEQYKKRHFNS